MTNIPKEVMDAIKTVLSPSGIKKVKEVMRQGKPVIISGKMIKRIKLMIQKNGVAVVTRKHVHSLDGYKSRIKNGKRISERTNEQRQEQA